MYSVFEEFPKGWGGGGGLKKYLKNGKSWGVGGSYVKFPPWWDMDMGYGYGYGVWIFSETTQWRKICFKFFLLMILECFLIRKIGDRSYGGK